MQNQESPSRTTEGKNERDFDQVTNPNGNEPVEIQLREVHRHRRFLAKYRLLVFVIFLVAIALFAVIDRLVGLQFFDKALLSAGPLTAYLVGMGPPDNSS